MDDIKDLINQSNSIVITSHFSADEDAVASVLFSYLIINTNFPEKKLTAIIEGYDSGIFNYIDNKSTISGENLYKFCVSNVPDLLIMVDGNNFKRFSKFEYEKLEEFVNQNNVKTLVIDHHEEKDRGNFVNFINHHRSSCAEEVYDLFKKKLGLKLFDGYANILMFGILGDTCRFLYSNPYHRDTFLLVSQLIDDGANIEWIENNRKNISQKGIKVVCKLMNNLKVEKDFCYSYLDDKFLKKVVSLKLSQNEFVQAYTHFLDVYIRNIEGRKWGFIVMPDYGNEGIYKVSFRAISGSVDTTTFSSQLGGGGHKGASGARFKASNIEDAIKKILNCIRLETV